MPEPVDERREVAAVDHLPPRTLREREVGVDLGVRKDDDVVPAQSALAPTDVLLDEVPQRVAGLARLTDRVDLVFVAAAAMNTRSTPSGRPARPATRCGTSSSTTLDGRRTGCAGTTSSSSPMPRSTLISRFPSARGGRSSTAATSRRSSTGSSMSSSDRNSTDRCCRSRVSTSSQLH